MTSQNDITYLNGAAGGSVSQAVTKQLFVVDTTSVHTLKSLIIQKKTWKQHKWYFNKFLHSIFPCSQSFGELNSSSSHLCRAFAVPYNEKEKVISELKRNCLLLFIARPHKRDRQPGQTLPSMAWSENNCCRPVELMVWILWLLVHVWCNGTQCFRFTGGKSDVHYVEQTLTEHPPLSPLILRIWRLNLFLFLLTESTIRSSDAETLPYIYKYI